MAVVALLLFLPLTLQAQTAPTDSLAWDGPLLDEALSYIRLTRDDLSLRTDYVDRDSFRLEFVDYVMTHPLEMPGLLAVFRDSVDAYLEGSNVQLRNPGFHRSSDPAGESPSSFPLPLGLWRTVVEATSALAAYGRQAAPLRNLSRDDSLFVVDSVVGLLTIDTADASKSPEERDADQRREERTATRLAALGAVLDWRAGRPAGRRVVAEIGVRVGWMASYVDSVDSSVFVTRVERDLPVGRVVVGTHGADSYEGHYVLILDPGGDDSYDLPAMRAGDVQVIVDCGGNDRYRAAGGFGLGCGFVGAGFLYDLAGDDRYEAGSFALGAGFFGVGLLHDAGGNDTYAGDTYTQGAGGFGLGLLVDESGRDRYDAALYSQGFGFAAGEGVLSDRGGNDLYSAGGKYEDVLRYRDHYLSLSQGFAYGIRPYFSGGVGLLLDAAGNDVYIADIFGQGCSYWWGFGGLYDGGGNDQYLAFQYAQGSATHLTAGCLYDAGGDDRYDAKGVSQGCGHDWSAALLIDAGGNDRYSATDLSQAAGSANGVGVLVDTGGDDVYTVTSDQNTQGYGNPRRRYGSIGVFLDLGGGDDRHLGPGGNARVWIGESRWGVGVDR